jgi:hypothetical protein
VRISDFAKDYVESVIRVANLAHEQACIELVRAIEFERSEKEMEVKLVCDEKWSPISRSAELSAKQSSTS